MDRDAALMGLIIAALILILALVAAINTAAAVTCGVTGSGWSWPPFPAWLPNAGRIIVAPASPGAHLREPWASALDDNATVFWAITAVLVALIATAVVALAIVGRRRWRLVKPGHATRRDMRKTLSPRRARVTAAWTRGDLTKQERKAAGLTEVAVPLHRGPNHQLLVTSLENPTGVIAPTRSGKSRTDLIHKVLAAPGALYASTTKPDLAEWAMLARTRRPDAGPVLLCDATGTVHWPARVRWSPITGCHDPSVALRRAETLIEASSLGLRETGGNDKVFRGRASIVLQAYLLAAADHQRTVTDLVSWAITKPADQEPVELLSARYPNFAYNLASEIGMVAETSDAVWMSVRRALEPFMNPAIRDFATPPPGEELDIQDFLLRKGSMFVIAGEHQAPQARPVLTALGEQVVTTAQDLALEQERRRLEPAATMIFDELFDGTPVPRLPGLIADTSGRGVLIHWSAQSRSQLDELYGEHGRRQLIDNTLTLTVFDSIKDDKTLEWLSTLAGHHRRKTYQQHSDGWFGAGRTATGAEDALTYRPGAIRTLDKGRVLIIHANLRPILGRTVDVSRRQDWDQLNADVDAIRSGNAQITTDGYTYQRAQQLRAAATALGGSR
ncbi:type IV secretory system conjugative DNA transfer family protein [Amycolatopsis sp. lyj-108]|uniref:type IV secretory system conjugative DNA transfer family protein n=1 Tax=Amycolatopsis sp. lyj-108 TaxID=2789286 RepID=UPI00397BC8A5